jgi:hypothetical protein
MQGLQLLLLCTGAFLVGIALARVARRLRLHPGRRPLRRVMRRSHRSDHRHATIHMHRGAGQVSRLR